MWYTTLILISCISFAVSRPSAPNHSNGKAEENVEITKQHVEEITTAISTNSSSSSNHHEETQRKIEKSTKEILEKIAEVNENQGLTRKKPQKRPSYYFQFPFSYSRAQGENRNNNNNNNNNNQASNIFANPILEFLKSERTDNDLKSANSRNINRINNLHDDVTNAEDIIPGQYIKRKITHYQTVFVPNPYMPMMPNPYGMENSYYSPGFPASYAGYYPQPIVPQSANPNDQSFLENQTIENIKNLITTSRFQQQPATFDLTETTGIGSGNPSKKSKQNWNWPGAGLFPIYIRDPFLQMYYAVTNMVEYGPNAGIEGPCKLTPRPGQQQPSRTPAVTTKIKTNVPVYKGTAGINKNNMGLLARESPEEAGELDIEEIDVNDSDLVKLIINIPNNNSIEGREFRNRWESINKLSQNDTKYYPSGKLDFSSIIRMPPFTTTTTTTTTTRIPNQILQLDNDNDDDISDSDIHEAEKADDIAVSNQGSRKVFSKDNTGNGIFIHKLKVKQGGVAIAGPGGIATAGSGGTAIVGPNGVAYTHPNGLAIAGSGSKVVAVDPAIDLNDVIRNSTQNEKQQFLPNTRFGKVVAIGPVVYYNKGEDDFKE